jgi:glycosyltransferase involved in cell wall biosynthesis
LKRVAWADVQRGLVGLIGGNYVQAIDARFAVVDRAAAKLVTQETTAVLAREDACLASFRLAKELGVPRIYLLPTAHHATVQRLIQREVSQFPSAFMPAETAADFEPSRLARKDAELQMATHILCPSIFVQRSVEAAGISSSKLFTLPFGTEMVINPRPSPLTPLPSDGRGEPVDGRREPRRAREPIFLYAGSISGRKGVHRLVRVWKRLGAHRTHRLRLVGEMRLPRAFLDEYQGVFEHVPRIKRDRLRAEYLNAQAFVFNALADGFGHVVTEAMACRTPVLASRNCGAPDLIRDQVEGRLFDYGDDDALGSVLDWALTNPGKLMEMGALARERAVARSWDEFVSRFVDWVGGISNVHRNHAGKGPLPVNLNDDSPSP